jgi:hypothetical protein
VKIFDHPAVGRLNLKSISMGIHAAPGTRMIVYTAADEATGDGLARLAAGAGADLVTLPCGHRYAESASAQ